ncbi:MAG TPA: hypothetical protein VHN15_04805 [Thermoanaerobaculia bacterium]|nr:hypothetical protein [Thermoanaerobaculia bacterium]
MKPSSAESAPDLSDEPEVSPEGVDLSLIRWMLSLTPLQRLNVLQDFADGALALRDGRVEK